MNAIELIKAERERQVSVEGWTPELDDRHAVRELAAAGACYALHAARFADVPNMIGDNLEFNSNCEIWPFADEWWKPGDPLRDLVKAGALIVAEIERLQRESNKGITEPDKV